MSSKRRTRTIIANISKTCHSFNTIWFTVFCNFCNTWINIKKMQSITLCASASCYKEMLAIAEQLKKLGFQTTMSPVAYQMQRTGDFTVVKYKPWYKDASKYDEKTKLLRQAFKRIEQSD